MVISGDVDGNVLTEDRRKIQQDLILALTLDNTDPLGAVGVVPQLAAQ